MTAAAPTVWRSWTCEVCKDTTSGDAQTRRRARRAHGRGQHRYELVIPPIPRQRSRVR